MRMSETDPELITTPKKRVLFLAAYWCVCGLLFAWSIGMLLKNGPNSDSVGSASFILYVHFPAAVCMFVSALCLFASSVGYLWSRSMRCDDLSSAAGKATVLLSTVVLITGMFWGKSVWGHWWIWSPRLTFSLVMWALYVGYLIIRRTIHSDVRRASVCSVYGLIAFIDVPLVYVSVKLIPDIHPSSVVLGGSWQLTLFVLFVAWLMLTGGLIAAMRSAGYHARLRRGMLAEPENTESSNQTLIEKGNI